MKHPRLLPGLALSAIMALVFTAGCESGSTKNYPVTIANFLIEARPTEAGAPVTLPQSGLPLTVLNRPQFTEYDITKVQIAKSDLGSFLVFNLTPQASRDLYRFTVSNRGLRLLLTLNGIPAGARLIDRVFTDGNIMIFAEIPDDELPDLVVNLNKTSADIQKQLEKKTR
jgi:hypothetical protein